MAALACTARAEVFPKGGCPDAVTWGENLPVEFLGVPAQPAEGVRSGGFRVGSPPNVPELMHMDSNR